MATDAELNEYVGLKKLAPYRKGKSRVEWDPKRGERLKDLKDKVRTRTGASSSSWGGHAAGVVGGKGGEEEAKKKRKGKKERERAKLAAETGGSAVSVVADTTLPLQNGTRAHDADVTNGDRGEDGEPHKKKRKRKKHPTDAAPES